MRALLFALLLTVSTFACRSKAEPNADQTAKTGGDNGPAANREAQDKATEAEQARGTAKTEAASAQETADSDAARAHKTADDQLQRDFDASDRAFNALKEKAAKLTGAKKQSADADVAEITKREADVMAGIAKLRDTSGAQWDTTKAQVDADAAALTKAVDALDTTLR